MAEAVPVFTTPSPLARKVELDRPWSWLAAGWRDLRAAPQVSLAYGVLMAVAGYAITFGLWWADLVYLVLPMVCGFLIVGPLLAVGLYEVSRRLEAGEPVNLGVAVTAWRRNASQIGLMGVALLLLLFADALPFLIVGTAIGAVLAALAFAISAISIPLLLDRPEANVFTAIATSVTAVKENPTTMAFWAVLIVGFVGAGLITLYLGLIVTLPLIGHATWHAYRDLVAHES